MTRLLVVVYILLLAGSPAHSSEPALLLELSALPEQNANLRTEVLLENYKKKTSVLRKRTCAQSNTDNEIVVCGQIDNDKYRVPSAEPEPGDRRYTSVTEERQAIMDSGKRCKGAGAHSTVGCGGGLNIIAVIKGLKQAIDKIVGED